MKINGFFRFKNIRETIYKMGKISKNVNNNNSFKGHKSGFMLLIISIFYFGKGIF